MKLKALITTIVLGTSSLAAAAPTVRDHRTHTNTTVQINTRAQIDRGDGRMWTRPQTRPLALTWVTLANDAQLNGRAFIRVAPTSRQFTKLELRADQGRTSIDKVQIVFGNGRTQVVNLDAKLTKNKPSITIDLAGNSRNIERIVVVGNGNNRRAAIDVLAI